MGTPTPDGRLSDLLGTVRSWMPGKGGGHSAVLVASPTQAANLSRDFWMPDRSCRVCYECDAQFTVFIRRHHCRHCGRVFCARCTRNFVPLHSPTDAEKTHEEGQHGGERIRLCNYCFKRWAEEELVIRDVVHLPSPPLSPSLSTESFGSSKSSSTGCSTVVGTAFLHSIGPKYGSSATDCQHDKVQQLLEKHNSIQQMGNTDQTNHVEIPSNHFAFPLDRSDDEDDEDFSYHSNNEAEQFQNSDDHYTPVKFDNCHGYLIDEEHPADRSAKDDYPCPASVNVATVDAIVDAAKEEQHLVFNSDECIPLSSSFYEIGGREKEPVDFENNKLLWLPPEPENEEEEKEAFLSHGDDDEDATGEWDLRSSSFGSGYYSCRDRSAEEHKKAVKNIVDGHFRALVAQLLQAEGITISEGSGVESWLDIITRLSWDAASYLKPDTSKEGRMDPGSYVKVKCLESGCCSDSIVVKGVICKKNVAHRRMPLRKEKPRILILGGALEYQRISNLLSSFDTLLQQETDYLKMAVAKITAHQPNVLVVEKSVARLAQNLFVEKKISLVLNIKRPLLERLSRCTGAQIVQSIDHLSSPKLGYCGLFHVEKYSEEHEGAGKGGGKKTSKTLMYFEDCPKPLGCTILLKGANGDELKKVKHVLKYALFAAYHLALETCFLADEGATLPELPLKSPIIVALPSRPFYLDGSISTVPSLSETSDTVSTITEQMSGRLLSQRDNVARDFQKVESSVSCCELSYSSSSFTANGVDFPSDSADGNSSAPSYQYAKSSNTSTMAACSNIVNSAEESQAESRCFDSAVSFQGEHFCFQNSVSTMDCRVPETQALNGRFDMTHSDFLKDEDSSVNGETIPSSPDNQSILVSLSSRCLWKGTICERAHLFRIRYYGSFDKPLGRYLHDHLFDQSYHCRFCEMPSEAHVYCYTHPQGSLTISVRQIPEALPGQKDGKFWMWHRCLLCARIGGLPPSTKRIVMSDAAWGLSFGKFLELSFSNHASASRVASCGHSLHRDCLRFYGFGNMVACFRYASINVYSVYLPPAKLDFCNRYQEWVEKEMIEVAKSAERLFMEALKALEQISDKWLKTTSVDSEILELKNDIKELDGMFQKEKANYMELANKILDQIRNKQLPVDIFEINKLRRLLLFLSILWDQRIDFVMSSFLKNHGAKDCPIVESKEKYESKEKLAEFSDIGKNQKETHAHRKNTEFKKDISFSLQNHEGIEQKDLLNGYDRKNSHLEKFSDSSCKVLSTDDGVNNYLHPEVCKNVHKVLSDGQMPQIEDLSGRLDAKWRGDNSLSLDANISGHSVQANAIRDALGRVDAVPRFSTRLSIRMGDTVENMSSWLKMPYLQFYDTLNKNSGSAPRFDTLGEYNSIYISMFQELARQDGARLFLPLGINDIVIPIFDEEPTSIISYALISPCYCCQMLKEGTQTRSNVDASFQLPVYDSGNFNPFQLFEDLSPESLRSIGSNEDLSTTKEAHVRVSFAESRPSGRVSYTVICFYAKCFETLRKSCCPSEIDYVRSLSRCKKWGAQGGKSNVFFAKSLDDRFIVKQVTKTELESFMRFAPEYFKYISESISTRSPTCLAKILGIYQVVTKHVKGGKESRINLLVMENLLYDRDVSRLYDLKGSSRSRYNADASGKNKVLLDQNLIEAMPTSPIFVGNKAKRLLERAVWNDTAFLASVDVMDYSLLVGVDEEKHELVMGIIDFMRQYTWDKHLETWAKSSGILGGAKQSSPTVISPKQYKKRFRKAMSVYFIVVPDQWPASLSGSKSLLDLRQDNP